MAIDLSRTGIAARIAAAAICFSAAIEGCTGDKMTATSSRPLIPAILYFDGGGQVVLSGRQFSPPVAIVLDSAGTGVPGVTVTFTATGSGSVQPSATKTDANGRAWTGWYSGPGENTLTASAPGLRSVAIASRGIDSSNSALYELVDVSPPWVVDLIGSLVLADGWFYTSVACKAPATCRDSGWGTYGRADSTFSLTYANAFLQYWDSYADNHEAGIVRGDTVEVTQADGMFPPFSFRLSFLYRSGRRQW